MSTADRTTLMVHSGDLDRLFAAFSVAIGAAAAGMEVTMYFTFWGLTALRRRRRFAGKSLAERLLAWMLPDGIDRVPTSRMHLGGLGPRFFALLMRKRNVAQLPELLALAQQMGVKKIACETSMQVMGLDHDDLIDGLVYGGVATYLADAADSKVTLLV